MAEKGKKEPDKIKLVGGFVNIETGDFVDIDGNVIDRGRLSDLLKKNRRSIPLTSDTGKPALCYAIDAPRIPTWNGVPGSDPDDKSVLCYAIDTSEIPPYTDSDPDCYYVTIDEEDDLFKDIGDIENIEDDA